MANKYLKLKWRTAFKAADIDRNGTVDMNDARLFVDRFIKLHKLQDERAKATRQKFLALWRELFQIEGESIGEEEFLSKAVADYNNDRTKFRERIERYMTGLCGIYDVNGDGYLSEDEYLVTVKCHGIKQLDQEFIRLYPQVPGKSGHVDLRLYHDSWVEYMVNDDEENIGQEKPCLICMNIIPSD